MVYDFYTVHGAYLGKETGGAGNLIFGSVIEKNFEGQSHNKWKVIGISDLTGVLHMVIVTPYQPAREPMSGQGDGRNAATGPLP